MNSQPTKNARSHSARLPRGAVLPYRRAPLRVYPLHPRDLWKMVLVAGNPRSCLPCLAEVSHSLPQSFTAIWTRVKQGYQFCLSHGETRNELGAHTGAIEQLPESHSQRHCQEEGTTRTDAEMVMVPVVANMWGGHGNAMNDRSRDSVPASLSACGSSSCGTILNTSICQKRVSEGTRTPDPEDHNLVL
jgi:hypothetical protein